MRGFVVLLAVVVVGTLAFAMLAYGPYVFFKQWRHTFRFEVTIATPTGELSAYAVHQVTFVDTTMTPSRNYQVWEEGDAVLFDVGGATHILALTRFGGSKSIAQTLSKTLEEHRIPSGLMSIPPDFDVPLSRWNYPDLFFTTNLEEIDEFQPVPEQSEHQVVSARFVSTNEVPTKFLTERIPWLDRMLAKAQSELMASQTTPDFVYALRRSGATPRFFSR